MEKENIMRFGIATKGFVYVLFGGLTAVAAIGLRGGGSSDSNGALDYLSRSSIGTFVLAMTAAGMVAYVFWRFYQAFADSEKRGLIKKDWPNESGIFQAVLSMPFLLSLLFRFYSEMGADQEEEVIHTSPRF
jgi:hypothetical protein